LGKDESFSHSLGRKGEEPSKTRAGEESGRGIPPGRKDEGGSPENSQKTKLNENSLQKERRGKQDISTEREKRKKAQKRQKIPNALLLRNKLPETAGARVILKGKKVKVNFLRRFVI